MKRIDDRQLDLLITQSLQKEHDIKNINAQVLVAVKRYNRVRRWKTVVRTIAFAFGVPTMLAVMGSYLSRMLAIHMCFNRIYFTKLTIFYFCKSLLNFCTLFALRALNACGLRPSRDTSTGKVRIVRL